MFKRFKLRRAKNYSYSEDIDWENCKHERKEPFEIISEWEIDLVDVTFKCKKCERIGLVKARLDYDDEEVNWNYEEIIQKQETTRSVLPRV